MSQLDPTAAELGYDRRVDRAKRNVPRPEREHEFRTVDAWIARRLAPIDRYLSTTIGTREATEALAAAMEGGGE